MKRRTFMAGLGVAMLAAASSVAWKFRFFAKHYPPTPYDDVLMRLTDREVAASFGASVLKSLPGFVPASGAARLRVLLGSGGLVVAAEKDLAARRIAEAGGWVVPESVALIAALAAKLA